MAKKLAVACLLMAVLALALDLAESGKPTMQETSNKIQNFWPNKCAGKKSRRSDGSSESKESSEGNSEGSSEEKDEMCKLWFSWKSTYGGVCKVGSACAVQVKNKIYGNSFLAQTYMCTGGCPTGSPCLPDFNFCKRVENRDAFPCQPNAFTKNGELIAVFFCGAVPPPTTPPTTTTPTISSTSPTTVFVP